ncbi:MAG: putative peptidoglycan glycosyltransferase FtsW, partial [Hyphomicrobiales bacterium]
MTEMVYGSVPAIDGEPILPRWWRTVDKWSMSCILILFGIGILLGLAASPPLAARNGLDQFHYVQRQLIFGAMAFAVMFICSMLSPLMVRRLGVLGFFAAFIALLMLPFFGTDFGKGAVRWYSLGFASLQPSEFLKPVFMIMAAWLMAASQEINGPQGKTISFALVISIVGLLAMQPDFGQSALILFGWGVMYFVAGAPMVLLIGMAVGVVLFGMVAYNSSEHFARRIDGFLNPEIDPTTQMGYATNAIREGGFFGVGVGEGQVKWSLPDAHTDFIIAVAAEEYGLILVICIIALYGTITVRSLWRLIRERDAFIRLAGTGLACLFGVQAMINIGVAVRLLPSKGMT